MTTLTPAGTEDRALFRLGALGAVLGTLANVAATAGHGDLPEAGTAPELAFVAERASWSHVHLLSIVGVLHRRPGRGGRPRAVPRLRPAGRAEPGGPGRAHGAADAYRLSRVR